MRMRFEARNAVELVMVMAMMAAMTGVLSCRKQDAHGAVAEASRDAGAAIEDNKATPLVRPEAERDESTGAEQDRPMMVDIEKEIRGRAPSGITNDFFVCVRRSPDFVSVAACYSEEKQVQDRRMNVAYQELMKMLGKEGKQALLNAQRAWLQLTNNDQVLDDRILGQEQVGNMQIVERELFRLCKRANELEEWIFLAE